MKTLLPALLIGLAAAVVDTLPMILRRLDVSFILSAFFTWLFLGILVSHSKLVPIGWLNGLVVAMLVVIPILCLAAKLDRQAIPVMLVSTAVLGSAVGLASSLLVK